MQKDSQFDIRAKLINALETNEKRGNGGVLMFLAFLSSLYSVCKRIYIGKINTYYKMEGSKNGCF